MSLQDQRKGIATGFHIYPGYTDETTMGTREQVTWSSIRHLCSSEIAQRTLRSTYNISDSKTNSIIASNIKLYINQAFEFYVSASNASANTSPLLYYYCYMNLAKALCEIRHSDFRNMPESYRHGLSWHPKSENLIDMANESLNISTRGVCHILWEVLFGSHCNTGNPTNLQIKDLFALCPENSTEYERVYNEGGRLVTLEKANFLHDESERELWLRFSIHSHDLEAIGITNDVFLSLISDGEDRYIQVASEESDTITFEFITTKKVPADYTGPWAELLMPEIKSMNLFVHPGTNGLEYYVPVQNHLPIRLHQLILLYTLIFWLGSLVRYDPQSVSFLQDSSYWILVEGFINQSRLLLLDLFEWEFYQTESYVVSC